MSARTSLTKDEFQAWRAHPVTEIVHSYLTDTAQAMRRDWARGVNWTDEAKQLVQNLEDLAALDLESIDTFYEAIEADEQSTDGQPDTETTQDSQTGY